MMKTSICNELFQDWPYEKVFDYCAGLGFDAVELAPFTLAETVYDISARDREEIVGAANSAGVEISGLHWLLAKPEGFYINHPDEAIRKKTQSYLEALIELCGDLGGKVLVHGSPHQRSIKDGWDPDESWKLARETWEVCARAAEKHGVCYCLEALTTAETNFLINLDEACKMVDEIGSPNLQAMFDCRAISSSAQVPLPQALDQALKTGKIRHVHINDPNGRGPGFGQLEFAPLIKVLSANSYQGYISIEVFDFEPNPETIASRSLGYLHGIMHAQGLPIKIADFNTDPPTI
jgi:D-psicose/D-tagatose/L-ribulose 3-epimerase